MSDEQTEEQRRIEFANAVYALVSNPEGFIRKFAARLEQARKQDDRSEPRKRSDAAVHAAIGRT